MSVVGKESQIIPYYSYNKGALIQLLRGQFQVLNRYGIHSYGGFILGATVIFVLNIPLEIE